MHYKMGYKIKMNISLLSVIKDINTTFKFI